MQLIHYRGRTPNFGDDLNEDIWPALAPELFDGDGQDGFVGIGTIIGMPVCGPRRLHVFGSGAGYDGVGRWRGLAVTYWCVRGPITAQLVGAPAALAITDGATLTPLIPGFPRAAAEGGGVAIVPHWETLDHPGWDTVAAQTGFDLIDPRDTPRAVVERITRAKLVLAESLHGAIIADAYGIPWIAFASSNNYAFTKWADWTLSLGFACHVTMVPPPSAAPIFAFGRPKVPYGRSITVDAEHALDAFSRQVAPSSAVTAARWRQRAKAGLRRATWLHPMMGFNPGRTADALFKLAAAEAVVSRETVRVALRDRLLERLDGVRRRYRHGLLADAA